MAVLPKEKQKRRRNGQEASCEPCRQAKVRCDHSQPVCGRCRRRSLQAQCYYHPAPMTIIAKSKDSTTYEAEKSHRTTEPNSTPASVDRPPLVTQPLLTPVSTAGSGLLALNTVSSGIQIGGLHEAAPPNCGTRHEERVSMVVEVLTHLRDFQLIRSIIDAYFPIAATSNIPCGLIKPLVETLSEFVEHHDFRDINITNTESLRKVAEDILRVTASPINITACMTADEFLAQQTMPHIRLEYLGLLYAVGSRGHLVSLIGDARESFMRRTLQYASTCLQLSRELTSINDAMVWLSLETMILCSNIYGDLSEQVWRLLGELSSDIYAMGYHRESIITSNTPFFLVELRRKTFHKAYYLDVSLSSTFNRPPRILRRYSDCKLPLNLSDEEILADPADLGQALSRLSPEGWKLEGRYCPTSSVRLRSMASEVREAILEFEFLPTTSESIANLEKLSARNQEIWRNLPDHLKYTLEYKSPKIISNESGFVALTLTITYLTFLRTDFQIYQMIEKAKPYAAMALIETSMEILAIVSEMALIRQPGLNISDCSYVIVCFGLPAAAILATAAQNLARKPSQSTSLPSGLSPSALIRSLSVFVYQLQNTCRPGEANYDVCNQASRTISDTLNGIVDDLYTPMSATASVAPQDSVLNMDDSGMASLEALPLDILDGFDLSTWAQNIDWTGMSAEWSTL